MDKTQREAQDKEWEAYCEKLMASGAYKKVWNYFLEIVKTDEFIDSIAKLRAKYGIPSQGFSRSDQDTLKLDEWYRSTSSAARKEFDGAIMSLCDKFGFHFVPWEDSIEFYVFYNETVESMSNAMEGSLCMLADLRNEFEEPFLKETQKADAKFYPFGIRYSPYASERDIIDFVRRTYKMQIKPSQERYIRENKLPNIVRPKGRRQHIQQRDDFIYQHRSLPQKEIKVMVKAKFGQNLEYSYIGKIVSRERLRRQKV